MDIATFVAQRDRPPPPLGPSPAGQEDVPAGQPFAPAAEPLDETGRARRQQQGASLSIADFVTARRQTTQEQARIAVVTNAPRSAQEAAEAAKLAPLVGLPQAAVETDLPRFQTQAKAQRNADLVGQSPMLSAWVAANPDSARIAQDEFDKLGALEQMWSMGKDIGGDILLGTTAAIGAGTRQFGGAMFHYAGAVPEVIDLVAGTELHAAWERILVKPQREAAKELMAMVPKNLTGKISSAVGQALVMMAEMPIMGPKAAATKTAGGMAAVVEEAKATAKQATFPALVAANEAGADVYEKTGDYVAANKAAAMAYVNTVVQIVAPASATGTVAKRVATGGLTGAVTGEGGRALMNLVLPDEMQRKFDPEEALFNAVIGGMFGGVLGPRAEPELWRAAKRTYVEATESARAVNAAERLQAAGEVVADMKLREAAPDAFKDFARTVTESGDVREVWLPAKAVAETFKQSGIDPAVIRGLPEQLREGALTGSDVRISAADYITHVSGTPADATLQQQMRADPSGPTYAEAQAYFARDKAALKKSAEAVAAEKAERLEREAGAEAMRADVERQLSEAGLFRGAAKSEAERFLAFYETQARRQGKTVEQLYEERPLRVKGAREARPEALIQHRKRVSVLESIRECLS